MKAISRINPLFILIFLQIIFIGETNEEIQHRIQVEWISNNDKIALSKLEPAGKQSAHGFKSKTIYVARAVHQEETETGLLMGIIPGKLLCDNYNQRENNCICYYSHEGKSYESTEFEVLRFPTGTLSWVSFSCIQSFEDLITAGIDPLTNNLLYICRLAHYDFDKGRKLVMTGKLTNSNVCIVPYGFSEIVSTTDFEVLTINALGKWFSALDENIS